MLMDHSEQISNFFLPGYQKEAPQNNVWMEWNWNIIPFGKSHIYFSFFFSNFLRFWYHKKAHIILISHGKFHSWKAFRSEDINENVPGYGNHN